jgi:hypothetical protein
MTERPSCSHWTGSRCSLGLYGGTPSPGVCLRCDSYEGPDRGLGDTAHRVIRSVGLDRVVPKGCGGCSQRRAALNRIVPFGDRE